MGSSRKASLPELSTLTVVSTLSVCLLSLMDQGIYQSIAHDAHAFSVVPFSIVESNGIRAVLDGVVRDNQGRVQGRGANEKEPLEVQHLVRSAPVAIEQEQAATIQVDCLPTGVIELHKFSSVHSWAVSIDFVDQEGVLSFLAPGGFYEILSSTFVKAEVQKYHESNVPGNSRDEGWDFCYSSSLEREPVPLTATNRAQQGATTVCAGQVHEASDLGVPWQRHWQRQALFFMWFRFAKQNTNPYTDLKGMA